MSKCAFLPYSTSWRLPSSLSPNYPNGSRAGLLIVTISRTDNSTNHPHQRKQDTLLTASNELRVILLHRRQNNVHCKHTSESVASFPTVQLCGSNLQSGGLIQYIHFCASVQLNIHNLYLYYIYIYPEVGEEGRDRIFSVAAVHL